MLHTIGVFITNHPLFGVYLYFQIGIICAIIYSIMVHIDHPVDDDDDEEFLGFVISFILFWPFLLIFVIPVCLLAFIKIIGETVADVIERNK